MVPSVPAIFFVIPYRFDNINYIIILIKTVSVSVDTV